MANDRIPQRWDTVSYRQVCLTLRTNPVTAKPLVTEFPVPCPTYITPGRPPFRFRMTTRKTGLHRIMSPLVIGASVQVHSSP